MPAQGTVSQPGLIETLRWTPNGGYDLLDGHLARLAHSSAVLAHTHDSARVREALATAVAGASTAQRVRLEQAADGSLLITCAALPDIPADTVWRAGVAEFRLDPANALLAHKTTRRSFYDEARQALAQQVQADEAVFLNTRGEICEGSITSIFVPHDGVLLTPPLSCGLLAGVLRAHLLEEGRAREARLTLDDLTGEFFLGNSVRGLIRARLI